MVYYIRVFSSFCADRLGPFLIKVSDRPRSGLPPSRSKASEHLGGWRHPEAGGFWSRFTALPVAFSLLLGAKRGDSQGMELQHKLHSASGTVAVVAVLTERSCPNVPFLLIVGVFFLAPFP